MSAPEGNQFWKLRSTHGRELIFSSPTILWEACCEYFEKTDERKWKQKDWVGKDAHEVYRETDTPYTLTGLYLFLDIQRSTWNEYEKKEDFSAVCTRVRNIIYTQKFEGAAVGAYNANIIARDLGLKDHTDVTSGGDKMMPTQVIFKGEDVTPKEKDEDKPEGRSESDAAANDPEN